MGRLVGMSFLGAVAAVLAGCPFGASSPSSDTAAAACHAKGDFLAAMHRHVCDAAYTAELEALVTTDPDCKLAFAGKHIRATCPSDAGTDAHADAQDAMSDAPTDGGTE